jgi:hypothetical protein
MRKPHEYRDMNNDQLEELFSNYLLSSWSYSKVSSFARNEKAFEMNYIYGMGFKSSASTIAGQAYHHALELYFNNKKEGVKTDLVALEQTAFEYIENVHPGQWKLQKSTPTVEQAVIKANKDVTSLLNNFFQEIHIYDELDEILHVEIFIEDFLRINGVDIPLPCRMKIDLIGKIDGRIIIIDHKSKSKFTDEKDLKFKVGKQAITYVNGFEQLTDLTVDEVWFVENKVAKNQDKSAQLKPVKIKIDLDTRRLYESMLYEPLKRMLEAVSNPDYIYLINDSDNFVDQAEINEFWAQTMIAEVDDFNVAEGKKDLVAKRLKKIRDASLSSVDPKIIKNFKRSAAEFIQYDLSNKNMTKEEKIEHVLRTLGVSAKVAHTYSGYSSNTYLIDISAGVKIASLFKYRLDIARALNTEDIRMSEKLYKHEDGNSYLIVEASKDRDKDLLFDAKYLQENKIPLGVDNFNNVIYWDLKNHSTPHMLVGGSTGSGKTVFLVSILEYAKLIGYEKIVVFDPKNIDFDIYKDDPSIEVYNDTEDIEFQMGYLVEEMQELVKTKGFRKTLIIFDEFASCVQTARKPKQLGVGEKTLEENLQLLLQKSRALGFNLIAATQRASVKVINGDAKVNFPIQVCFSVQKKVDSEVMIDEAGAEILAGYGDGLIKSPSLRNTVRFQGFYKG